MSWTVSTLADDNEFISVAADVVGDVNAMVDRKLMKSAKHVC